MSALTSISHFFLNFHSPFILAYSNEVRPNITPEKPPEFPKVPVWVKDVGRGAARFFVRGASAGLAAAPEVGAVMVSVLAASALTAGLICLLDSRMDRVIVDVPAGPTDEVDPTAWDSANQVNPLRDLPCAGVLEQLPIIPGDQANTERIARDLPEMPQETEPIVLIDMVSGRLKTAYQLYWENNQRNLLASLSTFMETLQRTGAEMMSPGVPPPPSSGTPRTLGEAVKVQRKNKGMTLAVLAHKSGLSAPYISQLENGERNPSRKALEKLEVALDVKGQLTPLMGRSLEGHPTFPLLTIGTALERQIGEEIAHIQPVPDVSGLFLVMTVSGNVYQVTLQMGKVYSRE